MNKRVDSRFESGLFRIYVMALAFLATSCSVGVGQSAFITTWQTTNPGVTANTQIQIPGTGTNYSISWEEVGNPGNNGSAIGNNTTVVNFPSPGTYKISIAPGVGTFYRIKFNNGGDKNKIQTVDQWGEILWISMASAFYGCANLTCEATDMPDLSSVSSCSEMFSNCGLLDGPANIGGWDMSSVTNMSSMFYFATSFNQNIGKWDVSSVTNMSQMFRDAEAFNQDISAWDVSSVEDMSLMFEWAKVFNQDISGWDVSTVTNMSRMFSIMSFNQDIGKWDVSSVTNMKEMFAINSDFNQDIGTWNVAAVVDMAGMFRNASSFDQDIGDWDVSSVKNMSRIFEGALLFNMDISKWDVSAVLDMSQMFYKAEAFNQDIGSWNVSSVTNMASMFNNALLFNHDIGGWDVSSVVDMNSMFNTAWTFNQNIGEWDVSSVKDMEGMFSNTPKFNQDIGNWDVSSVTDMSRMFYKSKTFNQDIGGWDVSSVEEMSWMFESTDTFNQNISSWDVSLLKNMSRMFAFATNFNQDISTWDVSSVTNMASMFSNALKFNQDIGRWDVSSVTQMSHLFFNAISFNQYLGDWVLNPNVNLSGMFDFSGLDCWHYSANLIGWNENLSTPDNRILGAQGMKYGTNSIDARAHLKGNKGWTFSEDSPAYKDCSECILALKIEGAKDLCVGDTSLLTAGQGFIEYIWNTGETGHSITADTASTYIVTALDAQGCLGSDTVEVIVWAIPDATLNTAAVTCGDSCDGQISVEGVNLTWTYLWTTGDSTSAITGLCEGMYVVSITTPGGCGSTDTTFVAGAVEIVVKIVEGDSLYAQATGGVPPYTWLWSNGSQELIIPLMAGMHSVTVTDSLGCMSSTSVVVTDLEQTVQKDIAWNILPNPAGSWVRFEGSGVGGQEVVITVSDLIGHAVWQGHVPVIDGDFASQINLLGWQPGVYIVKMSSRNETKSVWLIKE
ncbi:MAG: BspA family leucine-rich repeat surface protein [Saprospiraceae bacterium]|nr:BspA family leucine-rich repeat surface protein [Saprospiraceae bacterium]